MTEPDDDAIDFASIRAFKQQGAYLSQVKTKVKGLFNAEIFEVQQLLEDLTALPNELVVREFAKYDFDAEPNVVYSRVKLLLPSLSQSAIQDYHDFLLTDYRPFTQEEVPAAPEKPEGEVTNQQRNEFNEQVKKYQQMIIALNTHNMKAAEIQDLTSSLLDAIVFADESVDLDGMVPATVQLVPSDRYTVRRFIHGIRKCNSEMIAHIKRVTYEENEEGVEVRFWFVDEETATKFALNAENFMDVYVQFGGSASEQYFLLTDTVRKAMAEAIAAAEGQEPKPEAPKPRFDPDKLESTF